ncbi:hypothetical protein FQN50_007552 [Emmonsiellopsis sp. PD_5]|nr:hypothetical protein FQN50_007552 [Emmonsiellopsis sp. PD_5]
MPKIKLPPLSALGLDLPPSYASLPTTYCTMCPNRSTTSCPTCLARYCSEECLETDCQTHGLLCSDSIQTSNQTPPKHTSVSVRILGHMHTDTYQRGILFPADTGSPKFIWVDTTTYLNGGMLWSSPDAAQFLGSGEPMEGTQVISGREIREKKLEKELLVVYRENFMSDGSDLNQSIITATGQKAGYSWCGNVVVVRRGGLVETGYRGDKRNSMKRPLNLDVTMEDFRAAVDFFTSFSFNGPMQSLTPQKCKGIKIAWFGNTRLLKYEEFVPVEVPRDHPVFCQRVSSISRMLGFPVKGIICESGALSEMDMDALDFITEDQSTPMAGRDADIKKKGPIGRIVIVREDGEELKHTLLQAMCDFRKYILDLLWEEARGDVDDEVGAEGVIKERFARYLEDY